MSENREQAAGGAGTIRIQQLRSSPAAGLSRSCSSRTSVLTSVTLVAVPVTSTLQPLWPSSSNRSTSKATTAPSSAIAMREAGAVRNTSAFWCTAKFTGVHTGSAPSV